MTPCPFCRQPASMRDGKRIPTLFTNGLYLWKNTKSEATTTDMLKILVSEEDGRQHDSLMLLWLSRGHLHPLWDVVGRRASGGQRDAAHAGWDRRVLSWLGEVV